MPVIGNRPQLNLIEGAAIDLKLADNPPDDEIDITISAKYPTRFMTLIPEDASLPTANPAAKATVDGTNFAYDVLDFDHTTEESANWEWYLTPDYLSENIVVDILWESAGAGDAKFGFSVLGREKGETWDAALGVEQTVVTTSLGAGKLNKSRITTFAPGWSPGDALLFKLARKAGDVADTIDGDDVRVLKVVVSYTGRFAQSFYPLAQAEELTLTATLAWTDMDVSSYIPAGATGVILHCVTSVDRGIGLRKKGSTDDIKATMESGHIWAMIGVDENRKFQYYVDSLAEQDIYIVGYTATGVVFFDNAYEIPGLETGWTVADLSAQCPNAIGIIVEGITAAPNPYNQIRMNGSTDGFYWSPHYHSWAIIGCDGSQVIEAGQRANCHMYVVGYVTEGAVFKINADVKTLTNADTWEELDCSTEAPSSVMLFFIRDGHLGGDKYGMRKNGDAEDIYGGDDAGTGIFVPCDSGHIVEGKAFRDTYKSFNLVGYATWAGA
ncbi:hypothetical protein ES708_22528 [subsurface metagenome]